VQSVTRAPRHKGFWLAIVKLFQRENLKWKAVEFFVSPLPLTRAREVEQNDRLRGVPLLAQGKSSERNLGRRKEEQGHVETSRSSHGNRL